MLDMKGLEEKFLVVKHSDIQGREAVQAHLKLVENVCNKRIAEGKNNNNRYLVINTDEPYADEVAEIMKRHGHWDQPESLLPEPGAGEEEPEEREIRVTLLDGTIAIMNTGDRVLFQAAHPKAIPLTIDADSLIDDVLEAAEAAQQVIAGQRPTQERVDTIITQCSDLRKYDDDTFTPPAFLDELLDRQQENDLFEWIAELMKHCAGRAIGMYTDDMGGESE